MAAEEMKETPAAVVPSAPSLATTPPVQSSTSTTATSSSSRLAGLSIVVVGGGIGGLATALALQQQGCSNVVVYERDASATIRRQGYGLTLTHNEKGPLATLGLLEHLAARDEKEAPSRRHWVFGVGGRVLGFFGNDFSSRVPVQRGNLRVPREELRAILLRALAPGTVVYGKTMASYNDGADGVDVTFNDGTTAAADVLVGADGIRSKVRTGLYTDPLQVRLGWVQDEQRCYCRRRRRRRRRS